MPPRKQEPGDPDKLARQSAGTYRTADERFEVRQSATGWFVIDSEQTDELGQPLMHGSFPTLKDARAAIPGARKTKPMPRTSKGGGGRKGRSRAPASARRRAAEKRPQPPPSWIDLLPSGEASEVRRLIAALGRTGIPTDKAEGTVRADREGLLPAIATRLIERRLAEAIDELPEPEREAGRRLAERIGRILTAEGMQARGPLPRWALVEIGPEGEPPNRRIVL
jgi:hypothetical protein